MNFWDDLYDKYKDSRYGILFLFSLLLFGGAFFLGVLVDVALRSLTNDPLLDRYFVEALPGIGLIAAAWIVLRLRQARARSRERSRYSPLSRDELRAARSKLRNGLKSAARPELRAPDTNLNY